VEHVACPTHNEIESKAKHKYQAGIWKLNNLLGEIREA